MLGEGNMDMHRGIFGPALNEMDALRSDIYGPQSFQDYCSKHNNGTTRTASAISIDSINKLDPALRRAETMVLRLGSAPNGGTGTAFGLIRKKLSEFFLFDRELFANTTPRTYISAASQRELLPFQLLPAQTETSVVNLAIATGLLSDCLRIEASAMPRAPATGQSTFDFSFKPHSSIDQTWEHRKGQVQIDAMFVGRRCGIESLFVIEAKHGPPSSLAKHKLAYAVLSVAPGVSPHMPVVPVYVRATREGSDLHFRIAECEMPDPRRMTAIPLDRLVPRQISHAVLPRLGYVT